MRDEIVMGDGAVAQVEAHVGLPVEVPVPWAMVRFECVGADGKVKWVEEVRNLITTAGKNFVLDTVFKGSSYTAAWYAGLKGAGSAAAGDTLASHGGWSEITDYSGNRKAITFGTTSGGSNTTTAVSFSITGTATVAGAFICTVSSGTSGTLYNAVDFGSSRSVVNGDTLNVTFTLTAGA